MKFKLKKQLAQERLMLKALEKTQVVLEESVLNNRQMREVVKNRIADLERQIRNPDPRKVQARD